MLWAVTLSSDPTFSIGHRASKRPRSTSSDEDGMVTQKQQPSHICREDRGQRMSEDTWGGRGRRKGRGIHTICVVSSALMLMLSIEVDNDMLATAEGV